MYVYDKSTKVFGRTFDSITGTNSLVIVVCAFPYKKETYER